MSCICRPASCCSSRLGQMISPCCLLPTVEITVCRCSTFILGWLSDAVEVAGGGLPCCCYRTAWCFNPPPPAQRHPPCSMYAIVGAIAYMFLTRGLGCYCIHGRSPHPPCPKAAHRILGGGRAGRGHPRLAVFCVDWHWFRGLRAQGGPQGAASVCAISMAVGCSFSGP